MPTPAIPIGNELPVAAAILSQVDPTQPAVPATGLLGVTILISATPGGAAIAAPLSRTAVESGSVPGTYIVTFLGADITQYLTPRLHSTVYICVFYGTQLSAATACDVTPAA